MADFKLTANGDIDLARAAQYPRFLIRFSVSDPGQKENKTKRRFPSLRLDFDTDIKQYNTFQTGLLLTFHTRYDDTDFKIGAASVWGKADTAQNITIRLKTELGEFEALRSLGSNLSLIRHKNINTKETLVLAEQYATEAISSVETDEPFKVSAAWIDDDSRYRYERLKITADTDNGTTIYEADI